MTQPDMGVTKGTGGGSPAALRTIWERLGDNWPVAVIGVAAGAVLTLLLLDVAERLPNGRLGTYLLHAVAVALTALALWLIIRPIQKFQTVGQEGRMEMIKGSYPPDVVADYFARFWAGRDHFAEKVSAWRAQAAVVEATAAPSEEHRKALKAKEADLMAAFDAHLREIFGVDRVAGAKWMLAVVAGIILYFAIAGGMGLAAQAAGKQVGHLLGIKPDLASVAAIFGAYTWVASDVIYRHRQTDLSSSDINWYVLRFVVAIPLGLALAQFTGFTVSAEGKTIQSSGAILAFVISMFSLSRIQEILGGLTSRAFAIPAAVAGTNEDIVVSLPGVDQRSADRLAAEGVSTISQIAVADPVRLSVRTGFSFSFVLELIDRAMLWQYLGNKVLTTRLYGWLGASDVLLFAMAQAQGARKRSEALEDLIGARAKAADALRAATAAPPIAGGGAAEDDRLAELEKLRAEAVVAETRLGAARTEIDGPSPDELAKAISDKAAIAPAGVQNLVKTVYDNEHVKFILRVKEAGPTTAARKTTTRRGTASPIL